MAVAAMAPNRIAAAILNDVGPDVDAAGVERILTYVGKDRRFKSWDEAADTIAANQRSSFEHYTHDDWLKMARRNCREDNGEVRFDYDMAIVEPFKISGPDSAGRPVAAVRRPCPEAAARRARREERLADAPRLPRGCERSRPGWSSRPLPESATRPSSASLKRSPR